MCALLESHFSETNIYDDFGKTRTNIHIVRKSNIFSPILLIKHPDNPSLAHPMSQYPDYNAEHNILREARYKQTMENCIHPKKILLETTGAR